MFDMRATQPIGDRENHSRAVFTGREQAVQVALRVEVIGWNAAVLASRRVAWSFVYHRPPSHGLCLKLGENL